MRKHPSLHVIASLSILTLLFSSCRGSSKFQIVERCTLPQAAAGNYPGTIMYRDSNELSIFKAITASSKLPFVLYKTKEDTEEFVTSSWRSPDGTMLLLERRRTLGQFYPEYDLFLPSDSKIIKTYEATGLVNSGSAGAWITGKNSIINDEAEEGGYYVLDLTTGQMNRHYPDWGRIPGWKWNDMISFNPKGDVALLITYLLPSGSPPRYNLMDTSLPKIAREDYRLMLWDLHNDKPLWFLPRDKLDVDGVDRLRWMPDGEQAVVNAILEFDKAQLPILVPLHSELFFLGRNGQYSQITQFADVGERVHSFLISPNGKYIAVSTETKERFDYRLYILDLGKRRASYMCLQGFNYVSDALWSPDSNFLLFNGHAEEKGLSPWIWRILDIQSNKTYQVLDKGVDVEGWTIP